MDPLMQFAQELLSTFSTALGEVALVPVSGGVFVVTISRSAAETAGQVQEEVKEEVIWDRKRDGGFPGLFPSLSLPRLFRSINQSRVYINSGKIADRPETKILKSLVRNVIEPERDLGHTDRALKGGSTGAAGSQECKDCK